jgi:hypothetical protein
VVQIHPRNHPQTSGNQKHQFLAKWENEMSIHSEETGAKFDHCYKRKSELEHAFGAAWIFDCFICQDLNTFMCKLDGGRLNDSVIELRRAECANCGFVVPKSSSLLANALRRSQIAEEWGVLREFGTEDNRNSLA